MKIPNPYYELGYSLLHMREYPFSVSRSRYYKDFIRWQRDARGPRVAMPGPEKLTAILPSYKRVHNMEPIVRGLLRTEFVGKVIVSNHNPEYRIADWIRLRDDRLQLIDQPRKTPAGMRFEVARQEPGPYFVTLDDDRFLYQHQLQRLFQELLTRPGSVHGLQGENYVGEGAPGAFNGWEHDLQRVERQVDSINGVYVFTREHLDEMFRLAEALGLDVAAMANGEDILLSLSGRERAWVHDVGPLSECLSSHKKGVATWRTRQGFFVERARLFMSLLDLKGKGWYGDRPLPPPPPPAVGRAWAPKRSAAFNPPRI